MGAIPNFATEKEQKRNFLYFTDVTQVVANIKPERDHEKPTWNNEKTMKTDLKP